MRKHTRRRVVVPQPPPGLRRMLDTNQRRDLALSHALALDDIVRGQATPEMLWEVAGATLTCSFVAQLIDVGEPEMSEQMQVIGRLIERFKRTGVLRFDGPDYQLAKTGLHVMDELALIATHAQANAAADFAQNQITLLQAS